MAGATADVRARSGAAGLARAAAGSGPGFFLFREEAPGGHPVGVRAGLHAPELSQAPPWLVAPHRGPGQGLEVAARGRPLRVDGRPTGPIPSWRELCRGGGPGVATGRGEEVPSDRSVVAGQMLPLGVAMLCPDTQRQASAGHRPALAERAYASSAVQVREPSPSEAHASEREGTGYSRSISRMLIITWGSIGRISAISPSP